MVLWMEMLNNLEFENGDLWHDDFVEIILK